MEKDLYIYTRGEQEKGLKQALARWKGKKVWAFSPHADDLSIAAGGFLHLLGLDNEVQPVLGFTGWRGINNGLSRDEAIGLREKEMTAEAQELGIKMPIFLRLLSYESGEEVSRDKDRQVIADLIEVEQPEIIFMPSKGDSQPRHSLLTSYIGEAVEEKAAGATLVYYETPWSLFSAEQINLLVPLDKQVMKRKMKAIKAHASQIARTDFVKISRTMLEYRALTMPEQKVGGFGSQTNLGKWMEVYRLERYKEE